MKTRVFLLCLFFSIGVGGAPAQTSSLLPWPLACFNDANGNPLAGGLLWSYVAGTSTPLATYSDASLLYANTNPVTLDSGGCASAWIPPFAYKLRLENSGGAQLWTKDNVSDAGLVLATALNTSKLTNPGGTGIVKVTSGVAGLAILSDFTNLGLAPTASPAFTGTPTYLNVSACTDASTKLATDQWVGNCFTTQADLAQKDTPVYAIDGSLRLDSHIVRGGCTLGTNCNVTFTGSAAFQDATHYECVCTDSSSAAACKALNTSGSAVVFTGNGVDALKFICVGE